MVLINIIFNSQFKYFIVSKDVHVSQLLSKNFLMCRKINVPMLLESVETWNMGTFIFGHPVDIFKFYKNLVTKKPVCNLYVSGSMGSIQHIKNCINCNRYTILCLLRSKYWYKQYRQTMKYIDILLISSLFIALYHAGPVPNKREAIGAGAALIR